MEKKNFNVLVSAGDTYERIDEVRQITHTATGRLGSIIADEFIKQGASVTFICGEHSLRPVQPVKQEVVIDGVQTLEKEMRELLNNNEFDCVVHSMAVSDYVINGLLSSEDLAKQITDKLYPTIKTISQEQMQEDIMNLINNQKHDVDGKIDSDIPNLLIAMERAPKVISLVKELNPNATLVGFKLLSDVSEAELVDYSNKQIKHSGSDYVLANDLSTITATQHKGILMNKEGIISYANTKEEIAQNIVSEVMKNRKIM